MSNYLGNQPSYGAYHRQVITGDGSTTTFALDYTIAIASQILVSLDAIIQEPEYSYTVSGLNITFASAPANASRIFILYLGRPLDSLNATAILENGAVTTVKIADSNVTTAKIANLNVTTDKIADSNVTTVKIADSNVTSAKLEDNIVLPGTDSVTVPKGGTSDRGTGVSGKFRFNTDDNVFEGYDGTAWGAVGGGATGAAGNPVFYENDQNVTGDYTITTNRNAMSAGPITVNSGVTVTIPAGSVWTIV
jgi:hypothetical protein